MVLGSKSGSFIRTSAKGEGLRRADSIGTLRQLGSLHLVEWAARAFQRFSTSRWGGVSSGLEGLQRPRALDFAAIRQKNSLSPFLYFYARARYPLHPRRLHPAGPHRGSEALLRLRDERKTERGRLLLLGCGRRA